jgi:hypothetical protein
MHLKLKSHHCKQKAEVIPGKKAEEEGGGKADRRTLWRWDAGGEVASQML